MGSGARTSSCVRAASPAPSPRSVERLRPKRAASAASCRACFGCCTRKTSPEDARASHPYAARTATRVASDGPVGPFVQPHDLRVIDLRNRVRACMAFFAQCSAARTRSNGSQRMRTGSSAARLGRARALQARTPELPPPEQPKATPIMLCHRPRVGCLAGMRVRVFPELPVLAACSLRQLPPMSRRQTAAADEQAPKHA